MSERTIVSAYDMVPVQQLAGGHYKVDDTLPDPNLICGIELEMENFFVRETPIGWHLEEDGSLRNHGREAISMPTATRYFEDMLTTFFRINQVNEGNYSDRCSTHIHVNVQDMTWTSLRVLCLLYQLFERLLFNYVGNNREENIFCVPWYQSGLSPQFVEKMQKYPDGVMRNWVKYAALNLLPVRSQGTVEFRHLHGTCDVAFIMNWMRVLSRMFIYAKGNKAKEVKEVILNLNTISNYDQFLTDVFGAQAALLAVGDYRSALSRGVVDSKLMLTKPPVKEEKYTYTDFNFQAMVGNAIPAQAEAPARRPRAAVRPAAIPEEIDNAVAAMQRLDAQVRTQRLADLAAQQAAARVQQQVDAAQREQRRWADQIQQAPEGEA